ncbi:PREDICTED: myosin-G heavy chain-like [Polistes canadensis]|uniref:myosin-G heavy chain-like n=1 Tax=Polistes canadensis TaxID=91411 RepID=UPI000718C29F|nr:PREDICTED: myosin-G heavy chain-like [Polistes canadensis]
MRRFDDVRGTRKIGASPPFRVITTRDSSYLGTSLSSSSITAQQRSTTSPKLQLPAQPPSPPPPTAPEPYKLVPSGTALGRAHRRSSFVIIAESRPATPESRSVSPTQPPGRVSPFRGRGFKGPPPRSRPDSPDDYLDPRKSYRRNVRSDSRASQQTSPRKSLIPQPTQRRRSVSLSKTSDERVSPKIGRRGDQKNWLSVHGSFDNVSDSRRGNLVNDVSRLRRDRSGKIPSKLSPIRGTPTKVDKSNTRPITRDPKNVKNLQRNTMTGTPGARFISPPKNTQKRERFITNDDNTVPSKTSKIPLKNNGSSKVSSSISMPEMSKNKKTDDSEQMIEVEEMNNGTNQERSSNDNINNNDQIGLTDLLKRTSGVTGTSSVVNTTTTTAVQPLRIDNSRIPIDSTKIEGQLIDVTRKSESSVLKNDTNGRSKLQGGQNEEKHHRKKNTTGYETPTKTNNERYSATSKEGTSDSSASSNNAIKSRLNSGRINKGYNRTTSRERLDGKEIDSASSKGSNSKNQKNMKNNNKRAIVDEFSPVSNTSLLEDNTKQMELEQVKLERIINDGKSNTNNDVILTTTGKIGGNTSGLINNNKNNNDGNSSSRLNKLAGSKMLTEATVENETKEKVNDQREHNLGLTNDTERITGTMSSMKTGNNETTNSTISRTNGISVKSVGDPATIGNVPIKGSQRRNNENHDENTLQRSLTRLSTGSNDSERSTDTGVSVDTVKGVSSPRVKRGMHIVKRPDEIETLSGNVMRPEQNGDPT